MKRERYSLWNIKLSHRKQRKWNWDIVSLVRWYTNEIYTSLSVLQKLKISWIMFNFQHYFILILIYFKTYFVLHVFELLLACYELTLLFHFFLSELYLEMRRQSWDWVLCMTHLQVSRRKRLAQIPK